MREILFRGRRMRGPYCGPSDDDGSKWYVGKHFQFGEVQAGAEKGLRFAILERLEKKPGVFGGQMSTAFVSPDTIGQWTGLTDRDGVRVFEGDILAFERYADEEGDTKKEELGIMFWDKDRAGFMLRCGPWGKEALFFPRGTEKRFCVVGNIHDNPELVQKVETADFGFAVRNF